jgi:hypothetical protein
MLMGFDRFGRGEIGPVWRLAILVLIVGGLVFTAASAARSQEPRDAFQVQGWAGGAYFDPRRGTFHHCGVSAAYGGVALSFLMGPADEFRIEFGADDWRLRPGGDYVATLMIDHREPLQVITSAASEKTLVAEFGPDEDIVKELRDGQFLRVLAEHIGISFSLSGSSQALQRLRGCVNDHRGAAAAAR